MSFVQIVGPRDEFWRTVDVIQDAGILHVEEVPLAEWDGTGFLHRAHLPDEKTSEMESYRELIRVLDEDAVRHIPRQVMARLRESGQIAEQYEKWQSKGAEAISGVVKALHAEVRSFVRRRRNIEDDLEVLAVYEEVAEALAPMVESQEFPPDHEIVGVIFDRGAEETVSMFRRQLEKITAAQCRVNEASISGGRTAAVVGYHKQFAEEASKFISDLGIAEIRPPHYLRGKPFNEAVSAIASDLQDLKKEQAALDERIHAFYEGRGPELLALRSVCHDQFTRLEAVSRFAQTRYTFIIEGWAPTERVDELAGAIGEACGEGVSVRKLGAHGAAHSPPIVLKNPPAIKPFQPLLTLLPLPKYGTIDPTVFLATFFPPLFGLMLGDIGYGLILVLGALLLWRAGRARPIVRSLGVVMGFCSFYTIVFGFVFGELFGTFGHTLGLKPIWRERLELTGEDKAGALMGYLILVVGVGAAHIMLGLILRIVNARRTGERSRMFDAAARIVGLFGLFFIIGRLTEFLPPIFTSLGVIALVIFLAITVWTTIRHPKHGILIPLELLSTTGKILSYARIMAVGMASAVLAMLANRFGSMISNVVLAALVVILVHALNLVLGIFDPTIQGLRLHYVEFFSNFYETGGRPYAPFRKIGEKM
jgi:V/A-type H+-transporting ATPase subunit I